MHDKNLATLKIFSQACFKSLNSFVYNFFYQVQTEHSKIVETIFKSWAKWQGVGTADHQRGHSLIILFSRAENFSENYSEQILLPWVSSLNS